MKKIIYLLFALFAMGCSQSNEDKIKLAFSDYVRETFDNPSEFEEIVTIDSLDTISTIQIKENQRILFKLRKGFFEYCDTTTDLIFKYCQDERYAPQIRYISELEELLREGLNLAMLEREFMIDGINFRQAEKDLEEIMSLKDTIFYQQRLTYRIKTNEELKTCYIYSDTLYDNIQFMNSKIKAHDVGDVIKEIDKFEETYGSFFKLFELKAENNRKTLSILEGKFGEYN